VSDQPSQPAPKVDEPNAATSIVAKLSPLRMAQRVANLFWHWFAQDTIPQMAAALAYRTVFSLIPLILLAFSVLRLVGNDQMFVKDVLGKLLVLTGLNQIKSTDSSSAFNLDQWLENVVRDFSQVSLTGVGLVSAAMLIYAAVSLLMEVESSFNRVYGAVAPRAIGRRVAQYWMVITLGPILVYASFLTADWFGAIATSIATQGSSLVGPWLVSLTGFVTSVIISAVLLLILYSTVPNTRVEFRSAAYGALAAAVLLESAKYGFKLYLTRAGYQTFYGALGVLPLFLLWLYTTWFIVLLGLRVSFLSQHGHAGVLVHLWRASGLERAGLFGSAWTDPSNSVAILLEVARGFVTGKLRSSDAIADLVGLDHQVVERVIEKLVERGLIVQAIVNGRGGRYTLSRPPEQIDAADALEVGFALAGPVRQGPGDALLMNLRRVQIDAARGTSVAKLLGISPIKEAAQPAGAKPVTGGAA
jgi:membrane protein